MLDLLPSGQQELSDHQIRGLSGDLALTDVDSSSVSDGGGGLGRTHSNIIIRRDLVMGSISPRMESATFTFMY